MKMLRFMSVGLRASSLAALLLSTLNFQPSTLFAQGSLTPPGAPGPTMKTLDQIDTHIDVKGEKRIDVLTLAGDANNLFVISAPGSYYLSGNITGVSGKNGISINADNVTVDLNGFALIGVTGSGSGIFVSAAHRNLRIRNGSVQSWGGISGIDGLNATNSQFDHLRVSQNASYGLGCGAGNVLSEISAENNFRGIYTKTRCTLTACYAANNTGDGIFTGDSCTVTASTSVSNIYGFSIGSNCTIIGCTASSNSSIGIFPSNNCTIKDCTASSNGGNGIEAFDLSLIVNCTANSNGTGTSGSGISGGIRQTVKNCSASDNQNSGIVVGGDSLLLENHASHNGRGTAGAGINTSGGGGSRIEGNDVRDNNTTGILANATTDIVIRNSAGGNTTNYNPSSGTNFAPVQAPNAATNPVANFVH